MAVVAWPGQALGGDRALLGSGSRLEGVEEAEPHGLLQLDVPVQLDVGRSPVLVEVGALLAEQAVPTRVTGGRECRNDLIADGRHRPLARPAVGEELVHAQALACRELRRHRHATDVRSALSDRLGAGRALDDVVHARGHAQVAPLGRVHQHDARVAVEEALRHEWSLEGRCCTGIVCGRRARLVRDQLRLHDDTHRLLDRLDLVQDRGSRALDERDHPRRADADGRTGRRLPLDPALECPRAQVEHTFVRDEASVADVERLVVD